MTESNEREVWYYRDYYLQFFNQLAPDVQKKFNWTLQLISDLKIIPKKYFDAIAGSKGLYEIRVEVGSNIFRVFCFFDKHTIIVLLNGFQKKTQKTPQKEIILAKKLKKQYFNEKE
ncbi:MAG: type II toxin-antitoxin system RelE/ParE family toxin [Sediminibacterium sp.]|nr:type II toxin-antitoxin system RelE/ParE family toxin [Sediminibacterium sp.]